jgi:mono/diheme cytochrome c family protein
MNADPKTAASSATPEERKADPIPIWLLILMMLLLYWGMVYFDHRGGWFNRNVYTPYVSYDQVANLWPKDPIADRLLNGKKIFELQCAVCHMKDGVGNPGNGCPPLIGSEHVSAAGVGRVVRIVSKGLTGPIEVKGQMYGTGNMLAVGDQLPGDEASKSQQIADILLYVRRTFGGRTDSVDPAKVLAIRKSIADRSTPFTFADLKSIPETE